MSLRRRIVLSICGLALAPGFTGPVPAADEPPPEPGVQRTAAGGAAVVEAVLPGTLVAWAAPRLKDGRREIFALVAAPEGRQTPSDGCKPSSQDTAPPPPTMLYRVGYANGALDKVAASLPSDATALMCADLDGDGTDELLLVRPGEVGVVRFGAGADGRLETLMRDPDLGGTGRSDAAARDLAGGRLLPPAHHLGGVSFFGLAPDNGDLTRVADIPLPVSATRDDTALTLTSPLVVFLGVASSGRPLFAAATRLEGFAASRHAPDSIRSLHGTRGSPKDGPACPGRSGCSRRPVCCWTGAPSWW